jgi:serine/threonine-protein kinase PpkA
MATVYLAIQQSFGREVALKVMSPLLNSDPSFAARFMREARIVAQLNHASIVPVFDVGEHQSYHYLSMEYLPAGDLRRRILDKECDLNLALKVCTALSGALEIAHGRGFVHRDIKPENILFREDGTPVLTDFGIARALDSRGSMTLAGMMVGTPDYMSPEQVKGLELDGRSDLYSVGIVFYEILTGSAPFKSDSTLSVALKQVGEPLPPLPPEYAQYQEFVDCLTAKDREERFASGAEVVRALRLLSVERGWDRTLVRSITPTEGLSGSPASGTQMPGNPIPTADESRADGAARPSPSEAQVLAGAAGPVTATVPLDAQSGAAPRISVASLTSNSKTNSMRNWQLWFAAAGVAALVIYVSSVLVARPSVGARTSASTQPELNSKPSIPVKDTRAPAGQTTLPAQPTGASALQHSPPEQTGAAQTSIASSGVASDISRTTQPSPSKRTEEPAEAAARRKQLLAERRQRKAEKERLAAEARDAQLAAAQELQIQDLLAAAKTQYGAGALWQPAGSNAADSYRAILAMQPQRAEALAGAQRLANVLADEAEAAEASGNADSSRELIEQVQSLQPTHPKLPGLQTRLEQLQSSPTALDARDRGRRQKAAKYIARAVEDLDRKPLDFKAVDDATDQYDRALSTAPKAPGLPSLKERLVAAYPAAVQTLLDLHDTKRARKLIANAHKRNWSSPELEQLETTLESGTSSNTAARDGTIRDTDRSR